MQFIFFNAAGQPLFVREDAEQATWTVETLSMMAAFPYDADKVITRAMRIAFEDELGVLQPFEIRKVETMEPDHYQRLTCEHIAISELTDRHMDARELTNVTAQAALTGILTGTGWAVGNVTATGTSSADLALGSVWQNVRTIEANWNVYITPRVTFNTSGITGRYLDIAPAQGTWRGIRLSLDKNADEMGVVIDDTEVKTALFGYGASTDGVPLTFATAVWQHTAEHPAKPAGQTYLEDPDATAAYGRNGAARFGFYQNADITDAQTLLEKTWEALKATNAPRVTINCMVRDLYRMGYADQPIRLHDTAMVQIRQTNTNLQLEIIQLTVDLLDPTATRPTIGAYIPNIVYIQRDTGREARGGASNTLSGRRGGGGKSARENQLSEFETEIRQNQYQISLRAYQRDVTNMENILKEAGVAIDASGVIIYAGNNLTQMKSAIQVNDDRISLVVTDGANPQIKPAAIVAAINSQTGQSTVKLSANIIDLSSDVTFGSNIRADGYITCSALYVDDADIASYTVAGGRAVPDSSGKITIYYTDLNGVERELANFNIADTATYKAAAVDTIGVSITGDAVKDDQGVYRALAEALVTYKNGNTSTINVSAANVSKPYANGLSAAGLKIDAAKHTVTVDATDLKSATVSVSSGGWHQASGSTSTGENKISALIDSTEIASLMLSGTPGVGYSPVASSQVTPSILSSGTIYQITAYAYGVSASRYVKTPSYTTVSYARGGLNSYSGGSVVSLYYKERETYYPAGTHRWYWSSSSESLRDLYEQS